MGKEGRKDEERERGGRRGVLIRVRLKKTQEKRVLLPTQR